MSEYEAQEESISVSAEDCRRWSASIEDRLDEIKTKEDPETYRMMFLTAVLLLGFADQLESGAMDAKLNKSVSMDKGLN
jgi:hypothetical protein